METILIAYDLWDAVEIGIQPQLIIEQEAGSEGTGDEESEAEEIPVEAPTISREDKIKTAKALSLIQGALTNELFPRIRNEKTAKGAWEILRREFRGDKKVRGVKLQAIRADFEYLRMNDVESLDDYLARCFETGKKNKKWQGQNKKGSNWSQGGNFNNNSGSNWSNGSGGNWNNSFNSQNKQGNSSQGGVKPQCQVCQKYHFGVCRHKGKPRCGKCNRFGHTTKDCDNGKQVANCAKDCDATSLSNAHPYTGQQDGDGTPYWQ
ncbi:unnamed protein product [Prunus armeniaca]